GLDEPRRLDIIRQLLDIKEKLEQESKNRWYHGVLGADRRQSLLDNINYNINGIVESVV
ncbi:hypothetical protein FRC07_014264, partial [Ceratobasidium sp. 392]